MCRTSCRNARTIWARKAPPEPCISAHPPRLSSTPAFIRKAPLPFRGGVLLVGLAGVRNVPAQRAGTLGPCAHAQSPDGRATLPRSLASSPIPHVWLRPLPLYEKHPSLFRERCFWLGWQGSGMFLPKGPEHWGPALTRKARMGAQRSPGALLLRPSPTSGFDSFLCAKKHRSPFGERCFWLGWQGSNLRCGSQSPMPYRLATAQYKKKRTLFCIKSALSSWGG